MPVAYLQTEKCCKKESLNMFVLQIIALLLLYYVFKAVSDVLKNPNSK